MNSNFDRRFKRIGGVIGIGGILIAVFSIAITVGAIFLVVHVAKEVGNRGLKNIVEEIWEGPDK